MAKNLVIVESPAKAKTIKKFLGSHYKIEASMGHVRDLPKSQLGVEIDNDFEPKYITIRGKGPLLASLKKEAKKANKVYLAMDPDREGEAIAWHLYHALLPTNQNISRITFNEITKTAVKDAVKSARQIDMDLVDAQQARRVLDRIVGYKVSPLLWKKVKKGLSAGRVQSIALSLICKREKEIEAFIPEEYWSLVIDLTLPNQKQSLEAAYYGRNGQKHVPNSRSEVDWIIENTEKKDFKITQIKDVSRVKKAPQPFKTSTLQQEASKKLNFTASKTMRIAQQLYEGVTLKGEGTIGLITYLRTDSTRIAAEAHQQALDYIVAEYGQDYVKQKYDEIKKSGKTQDAHEAIRPTYVKYLPKEIKDSLSRDQYRLYRLIWERFIASRMKNAKYQGKRLYIEAGDCEFRSFSQALAFDGYLKLVGLSQEEKKGLNSLFDRLAVATKLSCQKMTPEQHFTQPPGRYTEASLVKTLEENGVGRPSTYAPTISTIQSRGYIAKEQKAFFATELGEIVNDMVVGYFENIINIDFTAAMERELDQVEEGDLAWKKVLHKFYPGFAQDVDKAEKEVEKIEIKDEESDVECELCGRKMVIKLGRYGKFLACPGFPDCRNTKPLLEKLEGVECPQCGQEIVIRKTKKGRRYYGCSGYPDCDFRSWNEPTTVKCGQCGEMMYKKGKKLLCSNENCMNIQDNVEKDA